MRTAAFGLLLLTACNPVVRESDVDEVRDHANVADANARNALANAEDVSTDLDNTQNTVSALADTNVRQQETINYLVNENAVRKREIDEIREHYNDHLVRWHGAAPR